jgi:hypothetical protein
MAGFVSGCAVSLTCNLYNNTDTFVQVLRRDKLGQEKHFSLKPKEWVVLKDWEFFKYNVKNESVDWNYEPPVAPYIPSNEYIEVTGFGPFLTRTIRAQLNADGKIYLIELGGDASSSVNLKQPEGYPLVPIR